MNKKSVLLNLVSLLEDNGFTVNAINEETAADLTSLHPAAHQYINDITAKTGVINIKCTPVNLDSNV